MNIGIEKAIKLTRKGKYQAALHLYNEILEREPSSLEARGHRAWLLRSIGSYEKALEDYIFIVKHVSGDEEALFRLGEMYILLGKKEQAIECFRELLEKNPNSTRTLKTWLNCVKENFCEEVEDQPDLYDATVMTPKEINPVLTSLRSDKYSYPASVFPQVGELLYSLVKCFHPKFVIETGTFLGYSAICIAQAMEDNKKGHLHSFDLFLPNEQYISPVTGMTAANMLETVRAHSEKANVSHRITFHKGDSSQQIGSVFEGREECVDLAFIDGDHTIQGCLKDWHAVDPLMNVGGIVILHDVVPQNCGWEGPRHLLDQIAKERADYYQAIELPTPDGYGVAVMQKIKGTKGVKKLKPTWRAVLADKKNRFVVKKHKIMRSLKGKKPLPSQ